MTQLKTLVLFVIMMGLGVKLSSQNKTIDSLKSALAIAKHDTSRCIILNHLIEYENEDKVWAVYNQQLLELSEKAAEQSKSPTLKIFYLRYLSSAYNNKGVLARNLGDGSKALEFFNKSLKIQKKIDDKKGAANSMNNIGSIYYNLGDIPKGLDYYHKSLKMREDIQDKEGIAITLNNIGLIYKQLGDIQKALEYYNRSLRIQESIGDKYGLSNSLNNIGFIYQGKGEVFKALNYYKKSLKIQEEINDKQGIAASLNNIGLIYCTASDTSCHLSEKECRKANEKKALELYHKSLKIQEEIQDRKGMSNTLNHIATLLLKQGRDSEAAGFGKRSLAIAKEIGFPLSIQNATGILKEIYKKQNNFKGALAMHELETQMNDSIHNEKARKASIKKQLQYQFEKKAVADSIKNFEEQKIKNAQLTIQKAQLKQEKTQRFALYGGLALMLIFAGFMFNRFKVTQRQKQIITLQKIKVDEAYGELSKQNQQISLQKEEIEKQKHKVEEHQKEIIDSITYAKRLQEAILPPKEFVTQYLPQNFILYKPKDLVAGDFYWAESVGNKFLIAAADSTGHGVPGAMVSVVCSNALNRSLKEFGLTDPGQLLEKTRDLVLETFSKSSSEVKDGMDISLLSIEKNEGVIKLKWAGANNPLWYLLPNTTELSEIKANKQPIGKTDYPTPFTTHEIEYTRGTTFYLFTDGFADQFGGEKGKKFKYKQLSELLIQISHLNISEQRDVLSDKFESWKGHLEQVDDVCIIGVRL
ncbi:MAG: protein serine/threonine phosphatase [Bacteroidetes bacterium]|nr:protein serine/threonine phosphatase [Bacteroidota bacterium]